MKNLEVVNLKLDEFIDKLYGQGFRLWRKRDNPKQYIYGKILYSEGYEGELQDWIEIHIYPEENIAYEEFHTNRMVSGWHLCPACGQWYTDRDAELHEECTFREFYFD